jgi:fibronectin type 3 domain-containing protein
VVAQDLPVVEPADAPLTLGAQASADGVRLSWQGPDAGAEDLAYNVYRGPVDGTLAERPLNLKPVASLEYLDATVESGKVYRYVVRTVAAPSPPFRESVSSPPVVVDASDRFAPAAPTGLVAVQEGRAIRLLWDPGTEPDLDGYRVYRRVGDGPWEPVGELVRQASFLDTAVEPDLLVRYRVSAVDRATPPNESEPSAPVERTVAAEPPDAP